MTYNIASIIFVVVTTAHFYIISPADYYGSDDNRGEDYFSELNEDYGDDYGYDYGDDYGDDYRDEFGEEFVYNSTDVPTSSKRSITDTSLSCGVKKKSKSAGKFMIRIPPIAPEISEKMAVTLSGIEKVLITNENGYVWENFENLTDKDAIGLCIEAWKTYILPEIPEIKVKPGARFDCGISRLPGASQDKYHGIRYKGYIRYYEKKKGTVFIPDLIRCNCATVAMNRFIAVKHSKRFFFLLKHTGNSYFIFTSHGELCNREVKLVNYRKIVLPKE